MASTHKSLRSGTANKRPTTSIADGQIALNTNTTSPGLFFKDSTGATIIKVGPVHVGTTAPNASPAAGGSAGNSVGEIWLDTSLTPVGVKIWNGSAFVNATPIGSTTVQGLLELATSAETQTGTDTDRAVTPAGLQSKVSDSTSTTSSTTIASSTAVKSAYDLANAALPKSGGTVTGNLEIGTTGSLSFEGATADAFETTIAVTDPTADRTITLPDTTGTVVTTGDTGTVTSAMIADGTIVNADISASAEIAVSKLADGTARQLLQTDAAGTGVEWASNIDVPGTLDVTSTATFDSIASHPLGSAAAPTLTFTGDTNTGIYSPGADQVAISTAGFGRLHITSGGSVGINTSSVVSIGTSIVPLEIKGAATDRSGALVLSTSDNSQQAWQYFAGNVYYTGTSTNHPVIFLQNATERMRLDSSGRLGVGTSSAGDILHVKGGSTYAGVIADNSAATGGGAFRAYRNGVQKAIFCADSWVAGTSSDDAAIYADAGGGIKFYTNNSSTAKAYLTSGGSLGLGSSTPNAQLDVYSSSGVSTWIRKSVNPASLGFATDTTPTTLFEGVAGGGLNIYTATGTIASPSYTSRFYIDSSGRCGIGTQTPGFALDISGNTGIRMEDGSSGSVLGFSKSGSNTAFIANRSYGFHDGTGLGIATQTAAPIRFAINNSEAARIDSSSRLLVGTSTAVGSGDGQYAKTQLLGNTSSSNSGALVVIGRSGAASTLNAGDFVGGVEFTDNTGGTFGHIRCWTDAASGSNDYPGRLTFSTTADGASSPTERMRISQAGFVGIGETAPDRLLTVKTTENGRWVISGQQTQASGQLLHLNASSSSYADVMSQLRCDRAANSAYSFFIMDSNYAATPDREFTIRGDGNAFADGTWSGGGADYAEYFEWSDGNPDKEDRRGISVVLDGNQIRSAADGEDPIGVISGNPSVVGDAAWNKWVGKYLRDDYGTYILDENGDRQLNPAYDPDQEYVPREQRPEWDCVGLMGKLRIRKGQRTGSRWIKMRDISDSVEEWLVR